MTQSQRDAENAARRAEDSARRAARAQEQRDAENAARRADDAARHADANRHYEARSSRTQSQRDADNDARRADDTQRTRNTNRRQDTRRCQRNVFTAAELASREYLELLSPTEMYEKQQSMSMEQRIRQGELLLGKKRKSWKGLAFKYDPARDYGAWSELDVGRMDVECPHCGALRYKGEPKGICCRSGKVKVDMYPEPPDEIKLLLDGIYASPHFVDNINKYNAIFEFTSLAANRVLTEGYSFGLFKASGRIYHLFGCLDVLEGFLRSFSQIYMMPGAEDRLERRMGILPPKDKDPDPLRKEIVRQIQEVIDRHHVYARQFASIRENDEHQTNSEFSVIINPTRAGPDPDAQYDTRRVFTSSSCHETAGIVVGDKYSMRPVIVKRRAAVGEGFLQLLPDFHPAYLCLQYPLLFPHGGDGFHPYIQQHRTTPRQAWESAKFITMNDYYKFQLFARRGKYNVLHKASKLANVYHVDTYHSVERNRLRFVQTHQADFRSAAYHAVMNAGPRDGLNIGRVLLPASFIGSPRWWHRQYLSVMQYVVAAGIPCLFFTLTFNPNWDTYKRELSYPHGDSTRSKPLAWRDDVVTRLFNQQVCNANSVEFLLLLNCCSCGGWGTESGDVKWCTSHALSDYFVAHVFPAYWYLL